MPQINQLASLLKEIEAKVLLNLVFKTLNEIDSAHFIELLNLEDFAQAQEFLLQKQPNFFQLLEEQQNITLLNINDKFKTAHD